MPTQRELTYWDVIPPAPLEEFEDLRVWNPNTVAFTFNITGCAQVITS